MCQGLKSMPLPLERAYFRSLPQNSIVDRISYYKVIFILLVPYGIITGRSYHAICGILGPSISPGRSLTCRPYTSPVHCGYYRPPSGLCNDYCHWLEEKVDFAEIDNWPKTLQCSATRLQESASYYFGYRLVNVGRSRNPREIELW